jgi:hypothetical protein
MKQEIPHGVGQNGGRPVSIELVSGDGQGNGLRQVLYRHENLALMRALFKGVSTDTPDSW